MANQERVTSRRRRQKNNFGGGPNNGIGLQGEKARDFSGTIKKLIRYLGNHKWTILFVWLLAMVSTIFTIVGPKILGNATDELVTGFLAQISGSGGIDFNAIGRILLILIGLYIISSVFMYLQGYVMSGVTMKTTYQLRKDISQKINRLPFSYFDKTSQGEVLSRITNDVDTINQTLNQSMTQIITSITSVFGITIMMLTISWQLTLVALCILPLSAVFVMLIVKKSQVLFANQQKYLGKVNGHVEEMLGAHVIVKSFNGEEDSIAEFKKYNDSLYNSAWKANFMSGMMQPITNFIGNLSYVAICIIGGYLAVNGKMTIGGIQSFIQYVRSFTQPITQLAQISNIIQQTAAAAERVFEFLEEDEEIEDIENALVINHDGESRLNGINIEGNVTFENISFGYDKKQPVIKNFKASVKKGQKIAIVGPTGAGKTTIIKLLMRFYDVDSGAIKIDGYDIKDFKRDELRSLFGMVLQDTWLFNGTIADNIKYGKLDATQEEIEAAAYAAQTDHFIKTLPKGYQMVLNEEADNISQGQKQLLTIARVILADPDILILDEATSSVDTRTEQLLQRAMNNLMEGRTSFIIAHRLSTITNSDLILVMNDGDIVEQGKHEELLKRNGFYANLYNSQFESDD
ncbi:ABC transporter ATP-binding protein/permease [Erysipelotrichaceae bacterium OttesenSCG-928-M19]|nr:ABC transporter ATP-binding protein/permease [Erysipelotrichaceae bacterium OttesenSCG-928-M19]